VAFGQAGEISQAVKSYGVRQVRVHVGDDPSQRAWGESAARDGCSSGSSSMSLRDESRLARWSQALVSTGPQYATTNPAQCLKQLFLSAANGQTTVDISHHGWQSG
jgi:hypothetical protein